MIRNWFRTRRRLHEDLRLLNVIIADHEQVIASLNEEMKELEARTEQRIAAIRRARSTAWRALEAERAAHVETRQQRDDAQARLARVVEELTLLREDIRRAEEIEHPPTVGGAGMVRPLAVRNPMADRILARPWPADLTTSAEKGDQ